MSSGTAILPRAAFGECRTLSDSRCIPELCHGASIVSAFHCVKGAEFISVGLLNLEAEAFPRDLSVGGHLRITAAKAVGRLRFYRRPAH
jgi:hypothetical protein